MRIRYIRDWSNGNTNGANNNWNEICAYDYNNTNIALNKTVTPSKAGTNNASVVTDGSDNASFTFSGLGNVTIDLGGIYDIDRIRIRRYFPSGNSTTQYHETKTEVSVNGQDWITVFDCAIEGKYYETSEGKIIKLRKDIDKLEKNSSLKDVKDKIIEIENSLQTTKDYFKNVLIDKDIECNEIDRMFDLINKVQDIKTGVNVTINNSIKVDYDFNLTLSGVSSWVKASTIQRNFYNGSAVVLNNEIHILGGQGQSLKHHKYNGSSWSKVSDLPYNFYNGSAVVLNNEIHILGGTNSTYYKYHYKYDGASWTEVSTLPYDFCNGSAVVYNNEIHILGSSNAPRHYKWNGSTWSKVSDLPCNFYDGSAVVLNNEIHILGSSNSSYRNKHYKYNGSSWTSVSTLPYNFYDGSAVIFNNEIHILGGNGGNNKYYKYNGSSWTNLALLPYYFTSGSAVELNDEIHMLGSNYGSEYYTQHYKTKNYYELERL